MALLNTAYLKTFNKKGGLQMIKLVYNMNSNIISLLSKLNSKIEAKYNVVPLSFRDMALSLNSRYEE